MQCHIQGYYQDDFESVTEGIDSGVLEGASRRNRATIHSCGDTSHLLTSLAQVRGLDAFEFGQGELVDWAEARTALKDLNLIFWPPARDQESLDTAFRILHEPKTFMYRGIELARAWDERW